jgi:cysteine-rich repeat protein
MRQAALVIALVGWLVPPALTVGGCAPTASAFCNEDADCDRLQECRDGACTDLSSAGEGEGEGEGEGDASEGEGDAAEGEGEGEGDAAEGEGEGEGEGDSPICGDNSINQQTEVCDDGDAIDGDGCDSNCTPTGCGNGVPTSGEECDDGNASNGDGCDDNCKITGCGNGVISPPEECDDGNTSDGDSCNADCLFPFCGDGAVNAGEACDGQAGCGSQCLFGEQLCVTDADGAQQCWLDIGVVAHNFPQLAPPTDGAAPEHPFFDDVVLTCSTVVNTSNTVDTICGVPVQTAVNGSALLLVMRSLTVAASANIEFHGGHDVVFEVNGDVIIAGQLRADAALNVNGAGARVCASADPASSDAGAAGGSHGSAGGRGGDTLDSNMSGSLAGPVTGGSVHSELKRGCRGGAPTVNNSGGAGGAIQISAGGVITLTGTVSANGGGGISDLLDGGAGGGSGGDVYLQARRLIFGSAGTLLAQGGAGAGGDGEDGEDGAKSTFVTAQGGTAFNGDGRGGNGAGGAGTGALIQAQPGGTGDHAGGGGGGAGRIGLALADCSSDMGAAGPLAFSPTPDCQ